MSNLLRLKIIFRFRVKKTNFYKHPSPILFEILRIVALCISKICWRIKFEGTENIPQNQSGGLLIAPNHQTYIDPVWVTLPVKRKFRYMAWDAAFKWFFVGDLIRRLGAFPVKTASTRGGKFEAMKNAMECLREGATLVVFPEGEREFSDGELLKFRQGAVSLAMETEVPILPVTIIGANKVWAQGMKYPNFGKVKIYYHPPITVTKPANKEDLHEHLEKFNEQLAAIIRSKL